MPGRLARGEQLDRVHDDPLVERGHQPEVVGDRQERRRRQQLALAVRHAHEDLGAVDLAACRARRSAARRARSRRRARARGGCDRTSRAGGAAASARCCRCPRPRRGCVPFSLASYIATSASTISSSAVSPSPRSTTRRPIEAVTDDRLLVHERRAVRRAARAAARARRRGRRRALAVGQDDPELVAAEPSDARRSRACAARAMRAIGRQHVVAGGVPVGVVDVLEVVDVDDEHRGRRHRGGRRWPPCDRAPRRNGAG